MYAKCSVKRILFWPNIIIYLPVFGQGFYLFETQPHLQMAARRDHKDRSTRRCRLVWLLSRRHPNRWFYSPSTQTPHWVMFPIFSKRCWMQYESCWCLCASSKRKDLRVYKLGLTGIHLRFWNPETFTTSWKKGRILKCRVWRGFKKVFGKPSVGREPLNPHLSNAGNNSCPHGFATMVLASGLSCEAQRHYLAEGT